MNYITNTNSCLGSLNINYKARNAFAKVKLTKSNIRLCKFLVRKHLIGGFISKGDKLVIKLVYYKGEPLLTNLKNMSKPSRRVFLTYKQLIKLQKKKFGFIVLDTSVGLIFLNEAIRRRVGGLLLIKFNLLK